MNTLNNNSAAMNEFENEIDQLQYDLDIATDGYNDAAVICAMTEYLVDRLQDMPLRSAVFSFIDVIARITSGAKELEDQPDVRVIFMGEA
jgi:hypothetical protein